MACKKQNGRQGDQLEVIAEGQVVQVMEHGDGKVGGELQKQMPRQPRRSTKLLIKVLEQDFLQLPHYSYFLRSLGEKSIRLSILLILNFILKVKGGASPPQ